MAVRCQLLNTCLRKDFAALKSFITYFITLIKTAKIITP